MKNIELEFLKVSTVGQEGFLDKTEQHGHRGDLSASVKAQHVTESHTEDICRVFTGEDYNQTIQPSKKSLRKSVWSTTYGKIKIGNSQKNF